MPLDSRWIENLRSPDTDARKRAIIELGKSGDADALPHLANVYRTDPVPELRELALRAGRHIKAQAGVQPAPIPDISPQPQETVPSLTDNSRTKWHYDRAMDYLVQNDPRRAAEELRKLLKLVPALRHDAQVRLLAGQVTKLPPDEAIETLSDAKQGQAFVKAQPRAKPRRESGGALRWVLLLVALVALGGAVVFFISSGALERYQLAARINAWEGNVRRVGNFEYYVLVPGGERPARGWPALVVLHGYGGRGVEMLLPFADFAEQEGVVLIAPSFGEYPFPYDNNTLPILDSMLEQVDENYGLNPFGAVFYGFSAGGEIASLYASYYPSQVAGITAEGAPEIHPPPTTRGLPYNILYGERDDLRQLALPSVQRLQSRGYPVLYEVVAGAEHEMTGRGVGLAMDMVRQSY